MDCLRPVPLQALDAPKLVLRGSACLSQMSVLLLSFHSLRAPRLRILINPFVWFQVRGYIFVHSVLGAFAGG